MVEFSVEPYQIEIDENLKNVQVTKKLKHLALLLNTETGPSAHLKKKKKSFCII